MQNKCAMVAIVLFVVDSARHEADWHQRREVGVSTIEIPASRGSDELHFGELEGVLCPDDDFGRQQNPSPRAPLSSSPPNRS